MFARLVHHDHVGRHRWGFFKLLSLLVLAVLSAPAILPANAQEDAPAEPASTASGSDITRLDGQLTPVGPKTYVLLDREGNPQKVLNISIEEFLEAWHNKQVAKAETDSSNRWTLNQADYRGKIDGNHVSLTARFTVTIHQSGEVQVPLGLSGAVLAKLPPPPVDQEGRFLRFDSALGGYLVTFNGSAGDTKQVELELMMPLERDGTRVKLRMLAPRAIKSELRLESPVAIQSAVTQGEGVLTTRDLDSDKVEIQITGLGGETTVSWVDRPRSADVPETTLTCTSNSLVKVNGREVETTTRLTVEGYGRSFRRFEIQLPPGAEYQEAGIAPPIKSIEPLPPSPSGKNGTRLRVVLQSDQSEPVAVNLKTKQTLTNRNGGSGWTLEGIAVTDALLQQGEILLQVDDDWQLRFEPVDGVRFIQKTQANLSWLLAPLDREKISLALRYVGQAWSVPMRVVPRQQQVFATPRYEVTINPEEALLVMDVAYRIEGGRKLPVFFTPRFSLAGWDHLETSMVGIEDAQAFEGSDVGAFADPVAAGDLLQQVYGFDSAYATSREPRVTLQLRRVWQPEEGASFAFELPYPVLDTMVLNASEVIVKSDTSLQITPDESGMEGLIALPIKDDQDASQEEQVGQQFRYRGNYAPLEFAARRTLRPQRVLMNCESKMQVGAQTIAVVQDLLLEIRHQAAGSIRIATPQQAEQLQVELLPANKSAEDAEGILLDMREVEAGESSAKNGMPQQVVPLPHPRLGKIHLRLTYQLPAPTTAGDSFVVTLVHVPGVEFGQHRLKLTSALGQALVPATGSAWQIESSPTGNGGVSQDVLTTTKATPFLPLTTVGTTTNGGVVEIDRVWVQTWFTPRIAQQRTAFRFRSTTDRLRVELPEDAPDGDQVEVLLDGKAMLDEIAGDEAIELNLPSDAGADRHTLELRYRIPSELAWSASLDVDRPRLVGNDEQADLFWQVITPIEYQPVWQPPTLVEDFRSVWNGSDWRMRSNRTTASLESWVGATPGLEPTLAEHSLVYQAWQDSTLQVTLMRRELLVLAVASLVVAAGIALWYVPWLRRIPVLLLTLVTLTSLGLAFPQQIATFLRFGFFGICCGLLAWLFVLMIPRRTPPVTYQEASGAQSDRSGSHRPSIVLSTPGSQVSTNAPTVAVEISESHD